MNKIQFLAIGDMVTDNFIELKDAEAICDIDHENCKLCVKFGQKIPYESSTEIRAVGNSANASVSASRLGLKTVLVAGIGDDLHGKNCIEQLKKENIDTQFISIDKNYPTNYHYVLKYGAERTILIKHAPFCYTLPQDEVEIDWVYLSSLGEHTIEFHKEISKWLIERPDTKLAFQPGTFQIKLGTEVLKDIYSQTELFFCNKEEAQIILNTKNDNIKNLLSGIHKLGPKKIVITNGPNGLTASDGEYIYDLPMYPDPAPPVDRTGAGDATSSTITSMLALGMNFKDALLYGPINSMSVVQYVGAREGLLSKDAIEKYLQNSTEYAITEHK